MTLSVHLISLSLACSTVPCLNFSHSTLEHWIRSQKSWCAHSPGLKQALLCHPCSQKLPLWAIFWATMGRGTKWRPFNSNAHNSMIAWTFVGADLTPCHILQLQTIGLQKGQAVQTAQTWITTCRRTGLPPATPPFRITLPHIEHKIW